MPDIHLRAENGQYVCAKGGGARASSGERIEPYRDEDGQYYWHRKAANNRKRADGGEGHHHNKEEA